MKSDWSDKFVAVISKVATGWNVELVMPPFCEALVPAGEIGSRE